MANQRPSRLAPSDLEEAPGPAFVGTRRWGVAVAVTVAIIVALAWFDGGEQALRPIAEDVPVPAAGA